MTTKRKPRTEQPAAPETTTPELAWLAPLAEETHRDYQEIMAQEDRLTALRREDRLAPYVAKARAPVEQARKVLPLLKAYQAESAQIRADGVALGLDIGPHSDVAESDMAGNIRNIEEASADFDGLETGRLHGDLDAKLAEILLKVRGVENLLASKRERLARLAARIKDVKVARGIRGLAPEGPPVQMPSRHPEGGGHAITEFDPMEVRKS